MTLPDSIHTRQPSLFSRESPILKGPSWFLPFSLFPPFFEYNYLLDQNWPKVMIFYSDNTLSTRIFGVSEINKQLEDDHFKVLCVILEVMSFNLQKVGVKQLKQTKFGYFSTPKFYTRVQL